MQFDRFLSVLEQKWLENQEIYYKEAAHLVYHLFYNFQKKWGIDYAHYCSQ